MNSRYERILIYHLINIDANVTYVIVFLFSNPSNQLIDTHLRKNGNQEKSNQSPNTSGGSFLESYSVPIAMVMVVAPCGVGLMKAMEF